MFYSQFILAKKGPLGTIWIAAHLERKLRKNQVADTDIGVSVDSILFPDVPIALRLSSHLLLGVVRIYSRKVNYLFDDCSDALLKVKQAFRSAAVDLPPEEAKAPYHSITLPETFDLDDFELPDTDLFQGNFVDHHVSSKEQITLQDTMDGVVYSTSQFGLDERFGDGDASQVGLDPDEELLLNKGTPSGHGVLLSSSVDPQASFGPSSTQKDDELDEEMHQASEVMDTNYCIEAPSTPGLVEGPNLPITQEALVSDDHMEEDHNPMELGAELKDNSAPSQVEYFAEQVAVPDNSCIHDNQMTEKPRSEIESPSTAEPMELIHLNIAHDNGSDKTFESYKDMDAECVQNGTLGNSDLNNDLAVKCSGEDEEAQENSLTETVVPIREPILHSCSAIVDNVLIAPDSPSKDFGVGTEEMSGGEDASSFSVAKVQDNGLNGTVVPICKPILQSCNNQESAKVDEVLIIPNPPSKDFGVGTEGMSGGEDASSFSVAKVQDLADMKVTGDLLMDATPCNKIDEQPVTSANVQFQNESNSTASELPSPEKMLSLPDVPVNQSSELFVGSTPEREVLVQGDQDATIDGISGKKRSFTESTITLQSLNSVECTEADQSKRTVDFVPQDDDLLSSILVGRRSTTLKVKSTPPAFDLVSSKRPRVTPRSGSQKRKVLVDDSTVLHGDTIRQQLVSTEDIRRVRKKAPSTHPEIWILQRHFLEEEMFSEPIFTGVSVEIVSLHLQPFDLGETKLVQEDVSKAQSTLVDIVGSPIRPAVGEESELEGSGVPSVALQSAKSLSDTPIQASVKVSSDLGSETLESERMDASEVEYTPSGFDVPENRIEMETEFSREPVSDEANNEKHVGNEAGNEKDTLPVGNEADTEKDTLPVGDEADKEKYALPLGDEADNDKYALPVEDRCTVGVALEGVDKAADGNIGKHRSEEGNLVVGLEDVESAVPIAGAQPGSPVLVNDGSIHAADKTPDEGIIHDPVLVSTEELPETELNNSDRGLVFDHPRADMETNSLNPLEGDFHLGNEEDNQNQFSESQIFMDTTATASGHPAAGNLNDLNADTIEHDTDFLNFDDDDDEIADDGNLPDSQGPQVLDNSGWSTRTRAVANYLQVLFQKEAQHGRKDLHLDNLLVNKSSKEASRMFFETLVLKTRDYIHVEQEDPFGNICVKPRARLLKPEF